MNDEAGFWFALSRLLARTAGRKVRRAEWSWVEAYGLGWLVFLIPCVFLWRECGVFLVLTPFVVWIGSLVVYFLGWLLASLLRRLGLYRARTNNPLQSFFILGLVSLGALRFLADPNFVFRSLGIFWFALLALNGVAMAVVSSKLDARKRVPPEGPASAGPV